MADAKHIPLRTCIVTREKKPKKELIRFVRTDANKVEVDLTGKKRGRGANLTNSIEVFDEAIKRKSLERALKINRSLSEPEIQLLRKEFTEAIANKDFRKGNKPVKIKVSRKQIEDLELNN